MARNLPTFQVSDELFDRLIAVFPDVDAYKVWLKETLITHVTNVEAQLAMNEIRQRQHEESVALQTELFGPPAPGPDVAPTPEPEPEPAEPTA